MNEKTYTPRSKTRVGIENSVTTQSRQCRPVARLYAARSTAVSPISSSTLGATSREVPNSQTSGMGKMGAAVMSFGTGAELGAELGLTRRPPGLTLRRIAPGAVVTPDRYRSRSHSSGSDG